MNVVKSSLWFAGGTLCSRLLGVIRESVVAGVFGAGISLDAFLVANRIPNMLRELLAEGALGSAFTKVYCEYQRKEKLQAKRLLREALLFFTALSLIIVTLGVILSPYLVSGITNLDLQDPEKAAFYNETVGLTRILFPFIGMMMMGSIAGGVLHERGRFFFSALSPIALNIGYLLGALVFANILMEDHFLSGHIIPNNPAIVGLSLGVLLGGFLQTLVQFWGIRDTIRNSFKSIRLLPRSFAMSPPLRKVLVLMGPMVIASSAGQINVLVNTNFATSLETGSVTWLTFSFRLLQLPIGLFAVAVASAALPVFTKILNSKEEHSSVDAGRELTKSCELVLWFMLACFSFFLFNSKEVVELVFQHGQFSAVDTKKTADALFFYSFSLTAYGLTKVLTAFYYALDRTQFAMKVSLASIIVNFTLNYLFVDHFGFTGLAMTASCVLSINALILILGLGKEGLHVLTGSHFRSWFILLLSFSLASCFQWSIDQYFNLSNLISESLKINSMIAMSVKGMMILTVFLAFGLLRLNLNPKEALTYMTKIKRRSR